MNNYYVLGIETSCDETSVAIINNNKVIYQSIYSQINTHQATLGVVPEIAAREHATKILDVINDVFKHIDLKLNDINLISVSKNPGLLGSLLVGLTFADVLSIFLKKEIVYVNHVIAHIISNWLDRDEKEFNYPIISLTVSGGHHELYLIEDDIKKNKPIKIGSTLDDAAGECFDKVAKMLKLGYPGGPLISKYAKEGDRNAIKLPKAMIKSGDFNFSFSGIKNAARLWIENNPKVMNIEKPAYRKLLCDFCASFEETIADIFVSKIDLAVKKYNAKEIHIAGGVSANDYISNKLKEYALLNNLDFKYPVKKEYSTDNAAMVALAGLFSLQQKT